MGNYSCLLCQYYSCTSETFASAMGTRMSRTHEFDCIRTFFLHPKSVDDQDLFCSSIPKLLLISDSFSCSGLFFPPLVGSKCAPALNRPHSFIGARKPTLIPREGRTETPPPHSAISSMTIFQQNGDRETPTPFDE